MKSSVWYRQNNAPVPLDITFTGVGAGTAHIYNNQLVLNITTGAATGAASITIDQKYFGGMRVIDMYIVAAGTTASALTLLAGSDAISDAIAHGTADKTRVAVGTIDDTYWDYTDSEQVIFTVATGVFAGLIVIDFTPTPGS